MTSPSENMITNSEDIFREIQSEYRVYQINSAVDAKKNADKIKKNAEEITNAMENARNMAQGGKIASDELKLKLSEKKDKVKGLQQEYERVKRHTVLISKKTSNLIVETSKITNAIDRIKESTQGLDPKYLERSQNDLANLLVKITLETEKAQSDLNAARKIEAVIAKKVQDSEIDFNKLESHTFYQINETTSMIDNVSITIEHIMKSYDEISVVSKELLKSAISIPVKIELDEEEKTHIVEQNQPYQTVTETKVAI